MSPWLAQMNRVRTLEQLQQNIDTDVLIVGGGIAGISTAYYILCMTKLNVVLVEADKLAHGATGHNAGQVVAYFERPFSSIVDSYGLAKAAEAQKAIFSGWELLDEIYDNAALQTPLHQFTGYAGCTTEEQVLQHLENKYLRHKAGINIDEISIASNAPLLRSLDKKYEGLYSVLDPDNVLSLLETTDKSYIAALSTRKGTLNSALFTEELAGFLLKQFRKRFSIFEQTKVTELFLKKDTAVSHTEKGDITSKKVVLCTNGFEQLNITNSTGTPVNARFHEEVNGIIGYMAGYIEPRDKPPTAISYFNDPSVDPDTPYLYLTRRPYELEPKEKDNLVCIGGPEVNLSEKKEYNRDQYVYPEATLKKINVFLKKTYKPFPRDTVEYKFHWHGLMGYTKNMLRLIGFEPCNQTLLYNLGCNGVGILPSIYGGKRIGQLINGDKVSPSVFDPMDSRCLIK